MTHSLDTLSSMNFNTTSASRCIEEVRAYIEESTTPLFTANRLINSLTSSNLKYNDEMTARHVAQYICHEIVSGSVRTVEDLISYAEKQAAKLVASMPWIRMTDSTESPKSSVVTTSVAVATGIDTKVEVKENGKIKKGGKQILAAELFALHVTKATVPMTNQLFIALLMKELQMTKAGATTYAYNCRNAVK